MKASDIGKIMIVKSREEGTGVQRKENKQRIKEIADYCRDPDATFPTPIIMSVRSEDFIFCLGDNEYSSLFKIMEKPEMAEVLDGQHRIYGILESGKADIFNLPIIFVFDVSEEDKAYIFSIINSKQTKVPSSLIYDLFGVSEGRSPQKTCHEIARMLNSTDESPFYLRLKMLGTGGGEHASLSQGSFVKRLMKLITSKSDRYLIDIKNDVDLESEDLPFNSYFIRGQDQVIFKVILNLFNGVRRVFPDEWDKPREYILSKAIGYGAVMLALPVIFKMGISISNLSERFFTEIFSHFKDHLAENNLMLTSKYFSSNEQSVKRLSEEICNSIKNIDLGDLDRKLKETDI
ncbi:DGQHR domain-containing protein [Rheinheimera muenzenbergensis]|uniref:DGQHR domain-containing protein n=2 Tax=Rheinheimera muenzenbergensis TaxID=1193628 RepID=A0ABU8CAU4_9GAMM